MRSCQFQVAQLQRVAFCVWCCWWCLVGRSWSAPTANANFHDHENSEYVQHIMRLSKAAEMRNYLNESTDPCDDFYGFACGNWAKINPANSFEHLTTGLFEVMVKALNRKIALLLKSGSDAALDTDIDQKVKDLYESCTNIKALRDSYRAKLVEIIDEFGEMPALAGAKWREQDFDWVDTVARIAYKYGISIIIGFDISADFAENTVNRLYIGHPDFTLESRSVYLDEVTAIYREGYKSNIARELRTFLGLDEKLAAQTAKEIVEFEIALAEGMVDERLGLGLDEISILTTLDEMQRKYQPTLDIKQLVNTSLGELPAEPVYEMYDSYQQNLVKVLKKTPKRIVANYIFYNLLDDFMLKAAKTEAKQATQCIEKTKKYFAKNLDNMVYRRYNNNKTEQDVNFIWQELKSTFRSVLESPKLRWIRAATRRYALQKLDAMKLEINSYAHENFSEEFGDLVINKHDYLENIKNILQLSSRNQRAKLHQPPKPLEAGELLSYTPANIIVENTIKVPVSLLQPYYLWAAHYPNALKFGTLGALVGHELIHGFDDNGRMFDKDGNNNDWWDDRSAQAFIDRSKCFNDQYSRYRYGGRYLPEMASQSENIADNGGLHLAYAAYLDWHGKAVRSGRPMHLETLPSLNYTSRQLFFISYAQVWCNDAHPTVRNLQTSVDQHVPGKYRVIGPLSNFGEFAKEFACPPGTVMNPTTKCEIY